LTDSKQKLRLIMKRRLAGLPPGCFTGAGEKAAALIAGLPVWRRGTSVLLFLSTNTEIDTTPLLARALAEGKKVFAPRVREDRIAFYPVISASGPWETGPFGIREPPLSASRWADAGTPRARADFALKPENCPALIIVPGLAFDPDGNRLGRGKGYYDRFLAVCRRALRELPEGGVCTIGLCLECQIVPQVPAEKHDKKTDALCTEAGMRYGRPS
jgi:5-formyltetrahydrofolate cyclo-ligase